MPELKAIPSNIITGFLGVGKTTAIRQLLAAKPADERWAVLVNEFGEIGIDGGLVGGSHAQEDGVYIHEVPGGCMCCTAGLPTQMALNTLLKRARPQRLLIEPTGLGHPREIVGLLRAEHYREVIDLRATLALVDARCIADKRYTGNDTFNQQLAIADVVVANKCDAYGPDDFERLRHYLADQGWLQHKTLHRVSMGALQPEWLDALTSAEAHDDHHHHDNEPGALDGVPAYNDFPECGYVSIENQGDGFFSRGWVFHPATVFDHDALYNLLLGIDIERLKGVFITDQGVKGYNTVDGVLTEQPLSEAPDSRLELISAATERLQGIQQRLLACRQGHCHTGAYKG